MTRLLYEGEDLSGGEWQKLALARSILRDAQILILDEPTSALDPQAESDFYEKFKLISENKTAIVISHKLISLGFVDKIFVMKSGQVVESGSFDELIILKGEFYRLHNIQAKQLAHITFT